MSDIKKIKFKKKVKARPAFDKRHSDPSRNYGAHGVDLIFTLIGEHGAVTFLLYTNWHLPHVVNEFKGNHTDIFCQPLPADIGYHSPVPKYEGQQCREEVCEYIGVPCYQSGRALQAQEFYEILVSKGSIGLWNKMKKYYKTVFELKGEKC